MTSEEREALKRELKAEILAELTEREETNTQEKAWTNNKALNPTMEKWIGKNRGGPMRQVMEARRCYDTWTRITRITLNILDLSWVREIANEERANMIADRLCQVVTELAEEVWRKEAREEVWRKKTR